MAKTDFDFSKAAQEFMSSMKIDTSAFDGTLKDASDFNAKLTKIALDAAAQNAELTNAWTQETLKKVGAGTQISSDPANMAEAATALATSEAEAMKDKLAAYAEVAKTAQEKTAELFTAASAKAQAKK